MLEDATTERERRIVFGLFLVAAVLMHVMFGLALGLIEPAKALAVATELPPVEFTPIEPAPEPVAMDDAPPEPEPVVPPPEPAPAPVRRERPVPRAEREDPAPPPEAETVVDLSNLTLTGDGSSSFAMQQGSGVESDRIGRPNARVTGRSREGVQGGVPGGTGATNAPVPAADLRRRPQPPANLNAILERHYPREARQQGVEGRVSVRIVVLADGSPAAIRITRETVHGYDFAGACRRAILEAGRWSPPPIGPDGQPASASMTFGCQFSIRR